MRNTSNPKPIEFSVKSKTLYRITYLNWKMSAMNFIGSTMCHCCAFLFDIFFIATAAFANISIIFFFSSFHWIRYHFSFTIQIGQSNCCFGSVSTWNQTNKRKKKQIVEFESPGGIVQLHNCAIILWKFRRVLSQVSCQPCFGCFFFAIYCPFDVYASLECGCTHQLNCNWRPNRKSITSVKLSQRINRKKSVIPMPENERNVKIFW